MTDLPDPTADGAAAAPATDKGTPDTRATAAPQDAGDPVLAALVHLGQAAPAGDPELAALVARAPMRSGAVESAALASSTVEASPGVVPAADRPELEPAPTIVVETVAILNETEGPAPETEFPLAAVSATPPTQDATAPRSRRGRSLLLRFAFAFVFGVALVGAVGAGVLYAWGLQYEGRVLPGVRLGTTDLSGLTPDQAQAAISKALGAFGRGKLVLNGPTGQTTIPFGDVGRGPDVAGLLDAALGAGRQGELFADLIGGPQAAIHGITLAPTVTYDRSKLLAAVDALAAGIDQPATNAAVVMGAGGTYSVTAAADGRSVDRAGLLAAIDLRLTALDAPADITLNVPVATVTPTVTTAAADAAKAAADRMAADLVIARGTDTWTIPNASLAPLIAFAVGQDGSVTPTLNAAGLDPLVQALAEQVNQKVQDATLTLSNNHVVASGQSREGRTLDQVGMKAAIVSHIAARQAGTAVEPLAAVVKAVQPKLSTTQATAYAAKMKVVGQYSVYYWVLINNYWGGNIEGPATKINGTVVPAGGTFDFWKAVGDLRKIPGVGPGNAIEGGRITVTGAFGGGICTTSTTLFNAAIMAGMVPGARQNHNEFIDRYPPGLDATVWIVGNARQTMSFTNDTQYPVLIQRVITYDGAKRWLTFKFWSVPNGRQTKITNLVIQPGAKAIDTVEKDPTHPVGWSYRVNTPVDGAKVWVTVTIYDHGKVHWTKRYYSFYPPVNGVLQVGTG